MYLFVLDENVRAYVTHSCCTVCHPSRYESQPVWIPVIDDTDHYIVLVDHRSKNGASMHRLTSADVDLYINHALPIFLLWHHCGLPLGLETMRCSVYSAPYLGRPLSIRAYATLLSLHPCFYVWCLLFCSEFLLGLAAMERISSNTEVRCRYLRSLLYWMITWMCVGICVGICLCACVCICVSVYADVCSLRLCGYFSPKYISHCSQCIILWLQSLRSNCFACYPFKSSLNYQWPCR